MRVVSREWDSVSRARFVVLSVMGREDDVRDY